MNHLIHEKSPYLLQHAGNPVDWYPWGTEAFQRAAREDKPVFLSIGYSTCHWCHVMAHESFEDPGVAELLNSNFISVKADREERPDIDAVYMAVCQAVTGSGGWPLTAVLTPEQEPFFVGTYFPKDARYGQPGLLTLLKEISRLWKEQRSRVLSAGRQMREALTASEILSAADRSGSESMERLFSRAVELFWRNYDGRYGGFGSAPKFPTPHNFFFLLRYADMRQDKRAEEMVVCTLRALACGGISDQIGGGFSRYSTDGKWLIPHFEKMLYDNALLLAAYLEAYQATGDILFRDTAERTLDYVLRELTGPEGGFFCGQDADSDGVEGKYYSFTPEEICAVLGEDAGRRFCFDYDITPAGNFEGKSVPNRVGCDGIPQRWREDGSLLKLCEYRKSRTTLHLDDKVILSWNAWMIYALAKASCVLGERKYLDAARRAHDFIAANMTGEKGRLFRRWRDGESAHMGNLDDYAVYGLALLELYRTTYEPRFLTEACERAEQIVSFFEDKEKGGFYLTAVDAEVLIARVKETYDGALPSGNAVAALLFGRLAKYTGDIRWQECSDRQNRYLASVVRDYPCGHSLGLVALMEGVYPSKELVCAGGKGEMFSSLLKYLQSHPAFFLYPLVKKKENEKELAEAAPFTESYPIPENGIMYYLCTEGVCAPPEPDFERLDL